MILAIEDFINSELKVQKHYWINRRQLNVLYSYIETNFPEFDFDEAMHIVKNNKLLCEIIKLSELIGDNGKVDKKYNNKNNKYLLLILDAYCYLNNIEKEETKTDISIKTEYIKSLNFITETSEDNYELFKKNKI